MKNEIWADGVISFVSPDKASITLTDGTVHDFTWRECARNGTSFDYLLVGDSARRRNDGCISSANSNRWLTPPDKFHGGKTGL